MTEKTMRQSGLMYLIFQAGETLPKEGQTILMGRYPDTFRVHVRKIYDSQTFRSGRTMMRVSGTQERIVQIEQAS